MSRKRDKPSYTTRHVPYNYPKRRRPLPPISTDDPPENPSPKISTAVVVTGIPQDCSVLDLKSRFEVYGSISRTRVDPSGVAYVTFRSCESAEDAIAASLDPSFGITINSSRVQVMRASDPLPQWREGVRIDGSSKLLRAEVPLSRLGRFHNRLGPAIVNPRDEDFDKKISKSGPSLSLEEIPSRPSLEEIPFKGREIVAYDDIL